jgi:hypothetical protein
MNGSFGQGWRDARQALGWLWPTVSTLAALTCIALAALLEARAGGTSTGTRPNELRLLEGATFGLVVPLTSFALTARLDGRLERILAAYWPRHGADRRAYALGRLALCCVMVCAIGILGASLALGASNASAEPVPGVALGLLTGFWALTWVAAQAALSYAACFGLAQLIAGSWGRALFLLGDWFLGSSLGIAALPWPRAHVRALLGGAPVLGMNPLQASLCLLVLTLLGVTLYAQRVPR